MGYHCGTSHFLQTFCAGSFDLLPFPFLEAAFITSNPSRMEARVTVTAMNDTENLLNNKSSADIVAAG